MHRKNLALETLVLTATGFALLPVHPDVSVSSALREVFGAVPRVPVTLREFCQALARLEASRADAALGQIAAALGTTFDTSRRALRLKGYRNVVGFEARNGLHWYEPYHYDEVQLLESLLVGWHAGVRDDAGLFTAPWSASRR